jgi:hypothetical protein
VTYRTSEPSLISTSSTEAQTSVELIESICSYTWPHKSRTVEIELRAY